MRVAAPRQQLPVRDFVQLVAACGGSRLHLVATQLADSPPREQTGGPPAPEQQAPQAPAAPACANCGAPMAPGQDWCLQCGAGAPGSVGASGRGPFVAVLIGTLVLLLAAAGAGYAALSRKPKRAPVVVATVAAPAPPAPAPATTPATPGVATTPSAPLAKPPKIPLKAATPTTSATTPAPVTKPSIQSTTSTPSTATGAPANPPAGEPASEALLLDTDAASTYNPYGYPAAWFGDPSLTIDGDPTTGWTAQVNPSTAPHLAEGVLLDLKGASRLASVKLITGTPGIRVQVYGTKAKTAPASITDPAWIPLSRSIVVRKRQAKIPLRHRTAAYRFVTVWVSAAPASAVGTPEAPGTVSIDELELFPPK